MRFSYIFQKKNILFFGKWNFLALRLKSSYTFPKKGFPIFREMEFSSPKLKTLSYFFFYFKRELAKLEKQEIFYILENETF